MFYPFSLSTMKKTFLLISLCTLGLLLTACGKPIETCSLTNTGSCTITETLDLTWTIDAVINAIKTQDFPTLSTFVGPQGIRFTPYEHVDVVSDIVLYSGQVYNALALSTTFTRWWYDGSWFPIDLPIGQYWEKFVYDVDFITAPEVYHNQPFNRGNTINNIFDVYSGKHIVEYHFPGFDPQYDGMDRRSLYLVFENIWGQRYIIGIIHWSWTI